MTFAPYANKGNVDLDQFSRLECGHWTYWSVFSGRMYDLKLVQKDGKFYWWCDCPGARHISHPRGEQCKHEKALARMLKSRYEQKCRAEIEAEQIAAESQERAEQSEIAALRAEVVQLRAEIQAQASQPDLTAILQKLAELEAENAEIKKQLATKATARKKHQSEQESADIKRQINTVLDDVVTQAENTIQAAAMARQQIKDLEAIPYDLKAELDAWTEMGKEELQPGYKAPDYNAPEVKAQIREAQEQMRKRREATPEERRKMAPLNGNQGFSFYR